MEKTTTEVIEIANKPLLIEVQAMAIIAENIDTIINDELKPMLESLNSVELVGEKRLENAKNIITHCNASRKAYDAEFIAFDKKYNEPKLIIDEKRKEINALIASAKDRAEKVKVEELASLKEKKMAEAKEYYFNTDIAELVDFEKIVGDKWGNESVKISAIKKEIDIKVMSIRDDLNSLEKLEGSKQYNIQAFYVNCLDMGKTINYLNQTIESNKKIAEQAKEREKEESERKAKEHFAIQSAKRKREEESEKQKQQFSNIFDEEVEDISIVNAVVNDVEDVKKDYVISINCTPQQLEQIEIFIQSLELLYDVEEI